MFYSNLQTNDKCCIPKRSSRIIIILAVKNISTPCKTLMLTLKSIAKETSDIMLITIVFFFVNIFVTIARTVSPKTSNSSFLLTYNWIITLCPFLPLYYINTVFNVFLAYIAIKYKLWNTFNHFAVTIYQVIQWNFLYRSIRTRLGCSDTFKLII